MYRSDSLVYKKLLCTKFQIDQGPRKKSFPKQTQQLLRKLNCKRNVNRDEIIGKTRNVLTHQNARKLDIGLVYIVA